MGEAGDPVRIGFDLDRDTNRRIDAILPWGLKSQAFRSMAGMLADLLEEKGLGVIHLLTENKLRVVLKTFSASEGDLDEG